MSCRLSLVLRFFRFCLIFVLRFDRSSFINTHAPRQPHFFVSSLFIFFFLRCRFFRIFLYHCRFLFVWRSCFVGCHPTYSGRQTAPFRLSCGRTSRSHTTGRSHRRVFPPSFCGASVNDLLREGFSRLFTSSTVMSNFVFPRHNRSTLVGHDVRGNPSSCDCTEIRTHAPTSEDFKVTN